MKPRLTFWMGDWFCQAEDDLSGIGVGQTFQEAYADWVNQRRMAILHARCVNMWLTEDQSTTFH